jgi:glycosyltransferase involved in cell wall biosynthesis
MIAHPAYDGAAGRSEWICSAMGELRTRHPLARFVAWSPGVLDDPRLATVRDSFVVAPQPVAIAPDAERLRALSFDDREGICVGELGKLITTGYTLPLDLFLLADLIAQRLPGVPLAGYNYYLPDAEAPAVPPSIAVHRPDGERFQEWLGRFRVFLSLTKHESFSRVPVEAQGLGVPVVYRPMPQSLTARLGLSALPARTERELADAVAVAYQDKATWTALHQSGLHVAAAHTDELVGVHWQHLLRRLRRELNEDHRPRS